MRPVRTLRPILFLLCALCAFPHPARCAVEFLRLGLGARALALGGVMLAAEDDPAAGYWNPAFLAGSSTRSMELMHHEGFAGATGFDALSLRLPLQGPRGEGLGLALLRFAVDDIPVTTGFPWEDVGPDGLPDTHDPGEGNGSYDPGEPVHADPGLVRFRSDVEWAAMLSYGRALGTRAELGLTAKVIHQGVADASSLAMGLDLGVAARVAGVRWAARLSDVPSTRVRWSGGARESVPMRLDLAAERNVFSRANASLRALLQAGTGQRSLGGDAWRGGLEWAWEQRLFLRAGRAEGAAAFGMGLGLRGFRVDYALLPEHELGASHRLSALARW